MKTYPSILFTGLLAISSATLQAGNYARAIAQLEVEAPEFVTHLNLENDFSSSGKFLSEIYNAWILTDADLPPLPIDFELMFDHLGLLSLGSLTIVSEKHDLVGYRNQSLFTFTDAPKGLFILYGAENAPFTVAQNAPADADLAVEFSLDGKQAFEIFRRIAIDLMGPIGQGLIDAQLMEPAFPDGPTVRDLIDAFQTNIQIVARVGGEQDQDNAIGSLPMQDLVVRLSNQGRLLNALSPVLQGAGFVLRETDSKPVWELLVQENGIEVHVRIETSPSNEDLLVFAGEKSREWYSNPTHRLAEDPDFKTFSAKLPNEGLGYWYNSDAFARAQTQNLRQSFPLSDPYQEIISQIEDLLLSVSGKQAGAIAFEGNSIRSIAYQPASYKANVAAAGAVILPLTLLIEAAEEELD